MVWSSPREHGWGGALYENFYDSDSSRLPYNNLNFILSKNETITQTIKKPIGIYIAEGFHFRRPRKR